MKTDVQTAGSALYDLREAYKGKKTYIKPNELPKINATKGFNIIAKEANKCRSAPHHEEKSHFKKRTYG